MRPIPSLRCLACGGEVETSLASLGSFRCHDCRDSQRPLDIRLARDVALNGVSPPSVAVVNGSARGNGSAPVNGSAPANGSAVTLTVRVRDAAEAGDLVEFLRVRACEAEQARGNLVLVRPHPTLRHAHVRAELEALLGAWRVTRPDVQPVVLG